MELFVVDAFANKIFEGNQAGVVLLDNDGCFPDEMIMKKIAAELKHSETAFVRQIASHIYELRYYTPNSEVDLCGHATISAFTVLRNEKKIQIGNYIAKTLAGNLNIVVEFDSIWMEMAQGKLVKELSMEESLELYQSYGLDFSDKPDAFIPIIVNTGLSDILLPVNDKEKLDIAKQNRDKVIEISKKHNVIGVHMFFYSQTAEVTTYCRNFAPLYDIDEESATGTSNGALTYYLMSLGLIDSSSENIFIQGESMGKPSVIRSKIKNDGTIYIGGNAVISIKGQLNLALQTRDFTSQNIACIRGTE